MVTKRIMARDADFQMFQVLRSNRNKRHRLGAFLVEGVRNINQAVGNGWQVQAWLHGEGVPLSDWAKDMLASVAAPTRYVLAPGLMAELCGREDGSELLAIVQMRREPPKLAGLSPRPLLAVFDRPSNRGNLGTIIRSCDALGVEALAVTGHCVDLYDPEVVVATMGSFFTVPSFHMPDNGGLEGWLGQLRQQYPGLQTIGTSARGTVPIQACDFTRPTVLFIGNETEGLCQRLCELSDVTATIPMALGASATSLNVACAATVMFYEAARQRRGDVDS